MEAFNFALLTKQGWKILQNPSSLVARVSKEKYHDVVPFLEAKVKTYISFVWRSILQATEIFKHSLRWQIGDGRQLLFWKDAWLQTPYDFKVITHNLFLSHNKSVSGLINPESRQWKFEFLETLFLFWDVEELKEFL